MAREKKSEEIKTDGWLATFSDTVTLLLTFFILLYSTASVNQEKMLAISSAFQSVLKGQAADSIFQYDLYNGQVPIVGGDSPVEVKEDIEDTEKMYEEIKDYIEKNGMDTDIDLTENERGIQLQINEKILFESGKADLIGDSKNVLDTVSDVIQNTTNNIIVEGHTDNVPIKNPKFDSNWELSTSRAVNVVRYFTEGKKQDPQRFMATGYGEFRPLAENSTPENRALNRRVNILIVAKDKDKEQKKEVK